VGLAGLSSAATTESLAAAAAIPAGSLSSFEPTTTFGAFVTMLTTQRWEAADIQTIVQNRQWSMGDLESAVSAALATPPTIPRRYMQCATGAGLRL